MSSRVALAWTSKTLDLDTLTPSAVVVVADDLDDGIIIIAINLELFKYYIISPGE